MKRLGIYYESVAGFTFVIGIFLFAIANVAAWFTHVFHCLQNSEWGFLIAGAIMFPIAIIHGWGIWFGIF